MADENVSIRIVTDSFVDPELADGVRTFVSTTAQTLGLDLSGLEAVTIANDYDLFLGQFELGFGTAEKLSASRGTNVGVGITPEVLRNGKLGSNVILPRGVADKLLRQDGSDYKKESRYIVSHELSHADEHTRAARGMSDEIIALHRQPQMFKVANRAIWGEYYACRKSALAEPTMTAVMAEMFHTTYAAMLDSLEVIKAQLLRDQDQNSARMQAVNLAIGVFMALSRFLGHVDGIQSPIEAADPAIHDLMTNHQRHGPVFVHLHGTLQHLWETFPQWNGLRAVEAIFDDLNSLLKAL